MAELEVVGLNPPEDSPNWFRSWAKANNAKLVKLFRSFSSITLSNISARRIETSVNHGEVITLVHNLNREPKIVLTGAGRVVSFVKISSSSTKTQIKPFLMQTFTTEISSALKKSFSVSDSSIFRLGDLVKINGAERKVTNIVGNTVTLSDKVDLSAQTAVILSKDVVTFLIL